MDTIVLAAANADGARVVALVFFGILAAGLVWLGLQPGRIAKRRGHPNAEAVNLCGLIGIVFVPALIVAFVWANAGGSNGRTASASPLAFEIAGVDRASGLDTRLVVEAETPANAKAKGELRGLIVTECRRAG